MWSGESGGTLCGFGLLGNRLRPEEEQTILWAALQEPDHSWRGIACWISDHAGFTVSEWSVYRVLKRHGFVREVQREGFPAGPEYRIKTTRVANRNRRGAVVRFTRKEWSAFVAGVKNGEFDVEP